ncbi:GNAT family N-acetyltransferase [Candidatus Micrarchaeota archaeon]|nr:GNAT family N-acetyltransferase [Candidatus Micrarchaeota archaeon]
MSSARTETLIRSGPYELKRVLSSSSREFAAGLGIIEQNFPGKNIKKRQALERVLQDPFFFFTVLSADDLVLATKYWRIIPGLGIHGAMIAVDKSFQGAGIGSQTHSLFLGTLRQISILNPHSYIFGEIEPPFNPHSKEDLVRFRFYDRVGWRVLKDVDYALPDLHENGAPDFPLYLYFASPIGQHLEQIPAKKVAEIVFWLYSDYYHRIYGLPLDKLGPLLSRALASLLKRDPTAEELVDVNALIAGVPNTNFPLYSSTQFLP